MAFNDRRVCWIICHTPPKFTRYYWDMNRAPCSYMIVNIRNSRPHACFDEVQIRPFYPWPSCSPNYPISHLHRSAPTITVPNALRDPEQQMTNQCVSYLRPALGALSFIANTPTLELWKTVIRGSHCSHIRIIMHKNTNDWRGWILSPVRT